MTKIGNMAEYLTATDETAENERYAESELLTSLGLPPNIKDMKLGHLLYLYDCLRSAECKGRSELTPDTIEILLREGYQWRKNPALLRMYPEARLYADLIVRLNEYDSLSGYSRAEKDNHYQYG